MSNKISREQIMELTRKNPDRINQLYKREAFSSEDQEIGIKRINRIVNSLNGKVLDVGCSGGILSILAARKGHQVVGIDMLPEAISAAKKELSKEAEKIRDLIKFKVAWAEELPFPDNSFDTVVIGELLEHVRNPFEILAESRRILREGAKVIISVPDGELPHPTHLRVYCKKNLQEEVETFFKIKSIKTTEEHILLTAEKRDKVFQKPRKRECNMPVENIYGIVSVSILKRLLSMKNIIKDNFRCRGR